MSNYLHQIAARNSVNDQSLLMPAHAPAATRLNDPFERDTMTTGETGGTMESTAAGIKNGQRESEAIASTVQSPKEQGKDAAMPVQPVKPVYFSKYMERNHYHSNEIAHHVITKAPDNNQVAREEERSVLSIHPSAKFTPATNEKVPQHITPLQRRDPVQQSNPVTNNITSTQKSISPKAPASSNELPAVLLPAANNTPQHNNPVLLQPNAPLQPAATQQKEKPVPVLVIGKLTVEIVPAQKPVNKIINHVVKPQPAAPASTQRNKSSFGLGQL